MTHIQSYTEVDAENSPGVGGGSQMIKTPR